MNKTLKIKKEMDYDSYQHLMDTLVEQNKTTGNQQSKSLINYTLLNQKRMTRLNKKVKLSEEQIKRIAAFDLPINLTVLTESWCGDAAQILPYINKIAKLNENITLTILLRDENLELMDQHLTNGSRSIPKLIMRHKISDEIISTFGPRPSEATNLVESYKKKHGSLSSEFKKELQIWYTKNKGQNIIEDLIKMLEANN